MGSGRGGSVLLFIAGVAGILGAGWLWDVGDREVAGLFALGGGACLVGGITGGITGIVARVIGFVVTAAIIVLALI